MLRKLLKHEFRATARVMLPLYLVILLLALGTRVTSAWVEVASYQPFLDILFGLITIGFVLALVAVFIVAVVLMILRFRSNLMADEGYVMFTLPVSTHQLIWSKLIVSTVWFAGACIVDGLALLVMVVDRAFFSGLGDALTELFHQLNSYYVGNGLAFVVEMILLFVVSCVILCLSFYTPLAIGHAFARHKMLLSVVFFFAIQIVAEIIFGLVVTMGIPFADPLSSFFRGLTPTQTVHGFMIGSILVSAIYGLVLYLLTIRMLHRHLNLE